MLECRGYGDCKVPIGVRNGAQKHVETWSHCHYICMKTVSMVTRYVRYEEVRPSVTVVTFQSVPLPYLLRPFLIHFRYHQPPSNKPNPGAKHTDISQEDTSLEMILGSQDIRNTRHAS